MNKKIDIEFHNVSKNYFLCRNDWQRLTVLLFPFVRKKYTKKVLEKVSFKIYQGEKIALIGKNGAGKSTILKIISNAVVPTSGTFKINRRLSILLDVGVGMEPDFTGIDNIYIRGAILGYTKKEIQKQIDNIVEFAGLKEYINLELKRYSAGMVAKLGFSINLFLHPEILIVDEALSVGDAKFNEKCKQYINKLSKSEELTLIIVSHNSNTLKGMCTRGIYINNGQVAYDGKINKALQTYNKEQKIRKQIT